MRILQIHSGINLNGAVRYAALVSRLLALRGHEIVILQRPVVDLGAVVALPDHIEVQVSSLRRLPGEALRVGWHSRAPRTVLIPYHHQRAPGTWGPPLSVSRSPPLRT